MSTAKERNNVFRTTMYGVGFVFLLFFIGGAIFYFFMAPKDTIETPPAPTHSTRPAATTPQRPQAPIAPVVAPATNPASPVLGSNTPTPATLPYANATATPNKNATAPTVFTNATAPTTSPSTNPLHTATNATGSDNSPTTASQATMLESSKAKPLNKTGNVVGGVALSPEAAAKNSQFLQQQRQKTGETSNFMASLARLCATNYWPLGTHKTASKSGVSTLSIKWLNAHYGSNPAQMGKIGNAVRHNRQQVLDYVLMPSMVNELYQRNHQSFIALLEKEAQELTRGSSNRHLSSQETAEMLSIYAVQCSSLSGALAGYAHSPQVPELLQQLQQSENRVHEEYYRLIEASDSIDGAIIPDETISLSYQRAVQDKESIHRSIAFALRSNGNTKGLDNDTLVYIAAWLNRRPVSSLPAIEAASACLTDLANKLQAAAQKHSNSTTQGLIE